MDLCWTVSTTDRVTLAYRSLGDSQVGKSVLVRSRVFDDQGVRTDTCPEGLPKNN
jgi:hypothetical protein